MIDLTALSKAVSNALRHEPWVYELTLDDGGWVPVGDLLVTTQARIRFAKVCGRRWASSALAVDEVFPKVLASRETFAISQLSGEAHP